MRFRQHQWAAQARTTRLFAWFAALLLALTLAVNALLALVFKLIVPFGHGFPALFFETNTAVVILFVVGGAVVETQRLRAGGGARVAHWLGGREVTDPDDALERRLLNVVDEMALASGQPIPRVFVMPREDAINAFVAGWGGDDLVLSVTRGALERLNRAELQGLVAHEFGHLKEDDLPLIMRLLALVWGLSLIHGYGQTLMSSDDEGRVSPLMWLVGLVLSVVGWLGWLAGRGLQAAIARQREYLADASAIQFTRTRDGLGNVLRKVWHDQEVLAGRMRSPAAEMVAALLLHEPGSHHWLSSHPTLPDRIRRICGAVLPPLPAPLLRLEAPEPRRPARHAEGSTLSAVEEASGQVSPLDPVQAATSGPTAHRQAEKEALARLQRRKGPTEQRLIVLALMMDPSNAREMKLWQQLARGMNHAQEILSDVQLLLPLRRVPEFERMADEIRGQNLEQKRLLVEQTRDLLRADGRVSPLDRLWWLALRHRLDTSTDGLAPRLRPQGEGAATPHELGLAARHAVASLTAYLARFIPLDETPAGLSHPGRQWLCRVLARFGMDEAASLAVRPPDADGLMHALAAVQELSWVQRPMLLKAWIEEAVNHSPQGLLNDRSADALRLMAGLLDIPLPPMLEAHYRPPR